MNVNFPDIDLPIALEAMGGDHGPKPAVEGAVWAANDLGIRSVLVGKEEPLRQLLQGLGAGNNHLLSIVHADEVVSMEDSPSSVIRGKQNSSLRISYNLVKEGKASGVVSAGNTGAMMAAGVFVLGTLPGIARPAIASLIPKAENNSPTVLLDSGANVDCHAAQLVQFALMGSCYSRIALGVSRPRVALLSNGSEASKGTDVIRTAAHTLQQMSDVQYIGYVEGRDFPHDKADVVVCDGFVGNVVLKSMEGAVELVTKSMKAYMGESWKSKLGFFLAKPVFKALFREKLDPAAYGGAPLLGLNGIGIVSHGSSNEKAFMNALRVAHNNVKTGLVENLRTSLNQFSEGL